MATKTIIQLPAASSVVADTTFEVVTDPSGTPVSEKATAAQVLAYAVANNPLVTATAANLADITNAINTAGKFTGKLVGDSTNKEFLVAAGATAGAVWTNYSGGADITPV